MKSFKIISLSILGLIILFSVVTLFSSIGVYNSFVQQENGITAQYTQNQNNYDNMWKKFKEASQVNEMYTDDLKKVFDSAIKSRYGSEGSKAMFNWLQEHNPNFDASLYKQLQVLIESGRNSFESNQKMLIDKKNLYNNSLQTFPNNLVAGFFGFPRIDMTKYDIVTSEDTSKAFDTKKAEQIKLRD